MPREAGIKDGTGKPAARSNADGGRAARAQPGSKRPGSKPAGSKQAAAKKPRTRSENLAQLLESEILSGAIAPGVRLDEQSLATRFGVSRTPVREALRHLASSGLVQIRAHQGAVVKQLTLTELLEIFQVIAELEGLAARLAARRMSEDDKNRLKHIHEVSLRHAHGREERAFFEENNRLHDLILDASGNKFLIARVHELRCRVEPYRRYVTRVAGVMEKSVEDHAAIIAAIDNRDGAAAHDCMRSHLTMLGADAGDFVAVLSMMDQTRELFSEQAKAPARSPRAPRRPRATRPADAGS
jgi:DNA-binding GntR family transcriptional regulator